VTVRPDVAAVIEAMAAAGPPFEELGAVGAREASAARRRASAAVAPAVGSVEDTSVPVPDRSIPVRIYRPEGGADAPVVVFLHGGGWTICDLDSHDALCRRLVRASGCTFVSVDYRLAPEHPFPAGLDDAAAVTDWACSNLASLGSGGAIGLMGDSAGANLAAVVALARRSAGDVPIGALALLYPIADCDLDNGSYREFATGFPLTRAAMAWYWDQYAPDPGLRSDPRLSPLRTPDVAGAPATYVAVAGLDPLRDEAEAFARRLEEASVDVTFERFDEVFHGFASVPALPESQAAIDAAAAHLRLHLGRP